MVSSTFVATVGALALAPFSSAFDAQAKTNVAVYYGQGTNQSRLSHFCHETSLDIINLGFVNVFPDQGVLGMPGTNFGNQCDGLTLDVGNTSTQFLTGCHQLAEDIPICQAAGKKVFLSLGGDSGSVQKIESDKSAIKFADFLWDSFGPNNNKLALLGSPRPFGDAVVDGFDFDIEVGGGNGYATMINRLREHFAEEPSRTFYISGAPQCPIPDAQLGDAIANAAFDFVWVQFYNTEGCSARNFVQGNGNPGFNFDEWVNVIKNSANPDAKLLVGLPASSDMTIEGFYLNPAEVEPLVAKYTNKYPETFGGIMLWEATASDNNVINGGTYADNMKAILYRYGPKPTPTPTPTPTPSQTPSQTPSSSSIPVHSSSPVPSSSPISSETPVPSSTHTPSSSSVASTSSSVLATSSTKTSSSPVSTAVSQSSSQVASSSAAPPSTPIASGKPTESHSLTSSSALATSTPVVSSTAKASSSPVSTRVSQSSSQVASSSSTPVHSSSSVITSNKPTTSGKPTPSSSVAVSASQSEITSSAVPTASTSKPVISTKSSSSVLTSTPVVDSQSSVIASASSSSVGIPGSSPAITPSASVTGAPSTTTDSKTVTTVVVTSYIDICPTGFTTVTTTYTTTYCPETAVPATPTTEPSAPAGWTTVATVCTHCAATPTTVTLTLPLKTTGSAGAVSTGTVNGNGSGNGNTDNTVTGTETGSTITATVTGNQSIPKPSGALPSQSSNSSHKSQSSAKGTSLRVPTAAVTPSGPVSTPLIRVPTGTGSVRASSTLYARPTGSASGVPVSPSGTTGTEPLFTGGAAKNVGSGVAVVMAVAAVLL